MYSVVIPLYNKAPYIIKALQSIENQTFNDYEIIVVNDGSTDDSLQVLQEYISNLKTINADFSKKITLINQNNQGVSCTRNNAVKIAKHPFIAFLDADDWWEPEYLSEMKSLIENFPDAGLWSSSYYVVKNNSKRLVRIGVEPEFQKGIINYLQVYARTLEMPVWTGATIIRKSVFEEERGFNTKLSLGEDFDLWIRVALKKDVVLLNKPLSNYNFDIENASKAVVNNFIYPPERHYIFNVEYLSEQEKTNKDLKKLLDVLRAYSLIRYRMLNQYAKEYKKEISKVDFKNLPAKLKNEYSLPVFVLKIRDNIKRITKKIIS